MKKNLVAIASIAILSTILNAKKSSNEVGINIGLNSINNADGLNFKNFRFGFSYLLGNIDYMVKPRVDIDIVKISDYYDKRVKYLYKGSLNGVIPIETNSNFSPYFFAGGGYELVDESLPSQFESAPFVQGGVGISYKTKRHFSINFESKALRVINKESQANEFIVGVGIKVPLGKKVSYSRDNDGDGIENSKDKCPNTPKGFNVDNSGCAKSVRLNINFPTAGYIVSSDSLSKIREFANYLKINKNNRVIIEGYTDNKGNFNNNKILSTKRAKSVVEQLNLLGINRARLRYVGYGELNPIATNKTVQGRALNRRIEAKIFRSKR